MLPVITMEGTVIADPELRFAPSGVAVGRMRLAANGRKFDKDKNEWVDDKVLYMDVTTFKQLAENCAESLRKGDLVVATGPLETHEWEDQDGGKRSRTQMIANTVGLAMNFRPITRGESRRTERFLGTGGERSVGNAASRAGRTPVLALSTKTEGSNMAKQSTLTETQALRRAYGVATQHLREAHRDEFEDFYTKAAADLGVERSPRLTAEQKAEQAFDELLHEWPHLADRLADEQERAV